MNFKIDPSKVSQGLKKSLHADKDKFQGCKLDTHKPQKGHTKGIKPIRSND